MRRGEETRRAILNAGLGLARDGGLSSVTLRAVGEACGRAHTGVAYYFETQDALRNAVAALAVERREAKIIARLLLDGHSSVAGMSRHERLGYLSSLA